MKTITRLLWLMLLSLPLGLIAQTDSSSKGIEWTQAFSWDEVLQIAKAKNKYIFVDCYATWCGPCKAMDRNVYPDKKVGLRVNDKFIAVKVQMDRTDKDDDKIRAWYREAKTLSQKYYVDAYPTLLFFSSDGSLIHRVTQGVNVDGFLDIVSAALDPQKRYYSLLAEYQNGSKSTLLLQSLIKAAQAANDKKMGEQITEEYFSTLNPKSLYDRKIRDLVRQFSKGQKANKLAVSYINQLKGKELYAHDNIEFIRQFTNNSKQKGFKLFYNNPERINNIMEGITLPKGAVSKLTQGDYAQSAVRWIIYLEEIYQPVFKPAAEDCSKRNDPDWIKLSFHIQKKYPKIDHERVIVDAKVMWYSWKENWPEYSKAAIRQMDINYRNKGLKGMAFVINNSCWGLFKRANDTAILNRAIYWMEEMLNQNEKDKKWGTALDTYANLLYKVGRIKEALEWEEKAVEYEPLNEDITQAFEKMKKGLQTWPQH